MLLCDVSRKFFVAKVFSYTVLYHSSSHNRHSFLPFLPFLITSWYINLYSVSHAPCRYALKLYCLTQKNFTLISSPSYFPTDLYSPLQQTESPTKNNPPSKYLLATLPYQDLLMKRGHQLAFSHFSGDLYQQTINEPQKQNGDKLPPWATPCFTGNTSDSPQVTQHS